MHEVTLTDGTTVYKLDAFNWTITNAPYERPEMEISGFVESIKPVLPEKPAPQLKKVIFNDPATVIYWTDGTKTVVKCQPGDTFDPLLGFLMAVFKKAAGNKGKYNDILRKMVPGYGRCSDA